MAGIRDRSVRRSAQRTYRTAAGGGRPAGSPRVSSCEKPALRWQCGQEVETCGKSVRYGGVLCASAVSVQKWTRRRSDDVRVFAAASEPSGEKSNAGGGSNTPQQANVALARVGKAFGKLGYFSFWCACIATRTHERYG